MNIIKIINNMISSAGVILLLGNRYISKIYIGKIYFTDVLLLAAIFFKFKGFLNYIKKVWPANMLMLIGVIWLLIDFYLFGFDIIFLRRFAVAFYLIIPFYIFFYGDLLYGFFNKYILIVFILISLIYLFRIDGFQASIALQLMTISLLSVFFSRKKINVFFLLVLVALYLFVSLGMMGDGFYKTPMLGLFLAFVFLAFSEIFSFFLKGKKYNLNVVYLVILIGLIFVISLFSPLGVSLIAEALYAISGLTGSDHLHGLASSISESQVRARGPSAGTASTRMYFWTGIVHHGLSDPLVFLFGNGHSLSFIDKIYPDLVFPDSHLIEPHNSFMGIFFRYGILGLLLFLFFLYKVRKIVPKRIVNKKIYICSTVVGLNFIFFEVALESPHGALLFWYIWLAPYFVGCKNKII